MVIAFIPVRGGSKSIPLKNIRLFCGKPLVCWNIEELEQCQFVDKVVVATDSDEIWNVVESRKYKKVELYHRSAENATDTSTTESVMLEYIAYADLEDDDVFMLVQATSPLSEKSDFEGGLKLFREGEYDSVLSCVRNLRFFWTENGESLNYDYSNRPRRQDFRGLLMENGAFYINTVKNIVASGNRLYGNIGVYVMPEYTATEIDEEMDWIFLENIKRKRTSSVNPEISAVKLFLCDVDGTMTDAGMYYSEYGDELKKFNTKDGMGFALLRERGVKVGVITSEITSLVERRMKKLNVDFLFQNKREGGKLEVAMEIVSKMGISLAEVAYIGDDVNCLELLKNVGFAACPADAEPVVKCLPGIRVMGRKGGDGCVREFINMIVG